tara:strand:- start:558 stop:779 length:222 start_codon:yes stop_codon:yes gene_type:complete
MFSGPKLLLLGAVLWLVWMAFRLIDRRNRARNADRDKTAENKADSFVELTECEGCGAYVTAAGCDNTECPVNS